jgi:heme/copper-type cytochrome/quinol oxidase subunit 2
VAQVIAQIAADLVYDPLELLFGLLLLLVPVLLVLLAVMMISYRRYLRFARAHVHRTVEHMERVESLLAQIAANTGAKRE